MFTTKKTIIYIKKNTIKAAQIVLNKHPKVENLIELRWSKNTLFKIFQEIKKQLKTNKVRILLDDDLSYILDLKIPADVKTRDERQVVADKIKEQVPEIFEDQDWDYKEVGSNEKEKEVIVFAPVKEIFQQLSSAVAQAKLEIEAIEPVALAAKRHPDPMIGLTLKQDIKGKDEDVLNVEPLEVKKTPSFAKATEGRQKQEDEEVTEDLQKERMEEQEQEDAEETETQKSEEIEKQKDKETEELKNRKTKKHSRLFILILVWVILLLAVGGFLVFHEIISKQKPLLKPIIEQENIASSSGKVNP